MKNFWLDSKKEETLIQHFGHPRQDDRADNLDIFYIENPAIEVMQDCGKDEIYNSYEFICMYTPVMPGTFMGELHLDDMAPCYFNFDENGNCFIDCDRNIFAITLNLLTGILKVYCEDKVPHKVKIIAKYEYQKEF